MQLNIIWSFPRATINLGKACRCLAFIKRRYVIPEDVKEISHDVLRHRIGLTYEAEVETLQQIILLKKFLIKLKFLNEYSRYIKKSKIN